MRRDGATSFVSEFRARFELKLEGLGAESDEDEESAQVDVLTLESVEDRDKFPPLGTHARARGRSLYFISQTKTVILPIRS